MSEGKANTRPKRSKQVSPPADAPVVMDRRAAYERAIEILTELNGRIGAGTLSTRLRQEGHFQVLPRICLMWKNDWLQHRGIERIKPDGPQTEMGVIGEMANIMDELGFMAAPRDRMVATAGDLADFAAEAMATARQMMEQGKLSFAEIVQLGMEAARSAGELESKAIDLAMREADAKRHENGEPLEGELLPPMSDNPRLEAAVKVFGA